MVSVDQDERNIPAAPVLVFGYRPVTFRTQTRSNVAHESRAPSFPRAPGHTFYYLQFGVLEGGNAVEIFAKPFW